MADATTRKLIELITHPTDDIRQAAIVVAGEVGSAQDAGLVRALVGVLDSGERAERAAAVESLGKLKAEGALPRIAALVLGGDGPVEAAARAAGGMGAKGARAMEKIMAQAGPVLRRRIASALAHGGTERSAVVSAHALLDEDPSVVEAAAKSLAGEVPTLTDGQRRALADFVVTSLQQKRKPPLAAASEAAMLRVLAALHHPKSEELFWKCTEATRPAAVRSAALQALGTLSPPKTDAKIARLLACAAEKEFQVAAPAMMLLKKLPADKKQAKQWLRLLEAPDVAARRFAVERLQDAGDPAVVKGLVAQLSQPDRELRDDAFRSLSRTPRGRQALVGALLEARTPDEAWPLARAEAAFAKELPAAVRPQLFNRACRYRDAEDRRADPLLFLLREIDADWMQAQLEARGLALRKKKDYAGAVGYLKLLLRDPACSEEARFELACTGLKTSPRDVAPEARQGDPTLGQFGRLLQNPSFDLLPRLKKARWLDAEDLFYLGFHFVEHQGREQQFGADVLQILIKRSPRSQLAKDAKRKLKSEALG